MKRFVTKLSAIATSVCMLIPMLSSEMNINAEGIKGSVTVTVYDEETGKILNDALDFSIIGGNSAGYNGAAGAIYVDGWNTEASNPHTTEISNTGSDWSYAIQCVLKNGDGFSYNIDSEKSKTIFDFTDGLEQTADIYMTKYYWRTDTEKFDAESFFVYVGTYSGGIPQFRYLYPTSDGSYNADKVIWENAPAGLAYGDIFVAEGDVPMTQVYPAKDDPANAHVYYYTLDEGAELIKAGNCPDLMEKKDMSVTSKTYDGSSHWSIRYMDAAGKEYYYGLSTFASSLDLDPLNCEVGDVYTYALYNDHMVVPLAKQTGTITDTMTVEVVEVHDKYLLVKPTDRPNSNERLTLSMEYIDTGVNPSVGMKYEVTYTDGILETYPEQFGNVKKVSLVSDDSIASGDVNNDGAFNISDVVLLQKWLLAVPDTNLANWKAVDFCADNKLDVFDLCLMKRALIYGRIALSTIDLKTQFPEYYGLSTTKGLEVYLWQETESSYKCGLLMGTNRNKTDEEIIDLTHNGATVEQMKEILSSYNIDKNMITIIPVQISETSYEIIESDLASAEEMFWGNSSDEPDPQQDFSMIKQLSADDIDNVVLSAYPPEKSVNLTKDQINELLILLNAVTLYEEDNSYNEYAGHWVQFDITLNNGEEISLAVFNPFFIINRNGYRAEYEPCQALNVFANSIIAE